MSTSAKTVLWIVIAVVVVGGGIWWWMASHNNSMAPMTAEQMQNMTSTSGTSGTTASSTSMPQGDSDQAIEQDMTSAGTQINGFASDSASIDQSINDQPIPQGQ